MTLAGYVFTLAVLTYASYYDLKVREVSDLVWIVGCPIGFALSLVDLLAGRSSVSSLVVSAAVSACMGFAFYKLGFVGGADALASLFLGLSLPAYPEGLPLSDDPFRLPFFAAFCNAVLLSLVCPVSVFFLNVADLVRGRRPFEGVEVKGIGDLLILLFAARRVSLERLLESPYYFPAERLENGIGGLVRVPVYFIGAESDFSEITAKIVENKHLYSGGILAAPAVPLIVFLTLGLALLPIGNLAFILFRLLYNF